MSGSDATRDRQGLEVLDSNECWELLATAAVGRVAFVDAGEPVILPVNHAVVGHTIAFLTTRGSKLNAAAMSRPVAFEVDEWDADARAGWSVLARGIAELVYDDDEIAGFEASGLQPWATAVERADWVRIRVDELSGRRL